jgi:hypothetical protein
MSGWRRPKGLRESANPVLNLWDAAAQHYDLRVTCWNCKRRAVFESAAVWLHFDRKGWSERLQHVPTKFRCRACGNRYPCLDLVNENPTDTSLPLPSDREWKREARRRR